MVGDLKDNMAAPEGNEFWKLRSSHGRNPIFATNDDLWGACCEYFQWVEDNPLYESKMCSYQGVNVLEGVPKMRAMTIEGMCLFLDIGTSTWSDYGGKEDFSAIVTQVEAVIRTQKFTGAAADLLNPNIIARELGLKDSTETTHNGAVIVDGPVQLVTVTKDEADNV